MRVKLGMMFVVLVTLAVTQADPGASVAAPIEARANRATGWTLSDPKVLLKVKRFLGDARGRYVLKRASWAYESFMEATSVGGSSGFPTQSGTILYGCKYHECSEVLGGALIDRTGEVKAVGLVYYDCWAWAPPSGHIKCLDRMKLAVFVRRSPASARLVGEMQRWGLAQAGHDPQLQVVWLRGR